eukprot:gene10038-55053_t
MRLDMDIGDFQLEDFRAAIRVALQLPKDAAHKVALTALDRCRDEGTADDGDD